MSQTVGTVLIDVKADTAKLVQGMQSAEKSINQAVGNMKKAIVGLAAAYVSLNSVKAFSNVIKGSIDAADALGKTAQTMGLATSSYSKLTYAAEMAGIQQGQLDSSLKALIRSSGQFVRDGGGPASKAMEELGISAEFARKNFTSTERTFEIVMDRLSQMPDGFRKTAIAQEIFSKSGGDMIRLAEGGAESLKKMGEEAERLGIVVGDDFAKNAANINDQFTRLSRIGTGIANTITSQILPSLVAFAKTAQEAFQKPAVDAENFAKISFGAIENTVKAMGFLRDVGTGISLAFDAVQYSVLFMSKAVMDAINIPIQGINTLIEGYNKLASITGMGQLGTFGGIDTTWTKGAMESLTKSMTESVDKLANDSGQKMAMDFNKSFLENLRNYEPEVAKVLQDIVYDPIEEIAQKVEDVLEPDFSKQRSAFFQYYQETGRMTEAWAIRQNQIMEEFTELIGEERAAEMAEAMKKNFFKPTEDDAQETANAIYDAFNGAARQMENSFMNFFDAASSGFGDFGALAKNILQDVMNQIIRMQIVAPMVSGITGMFGGMFAQGGAFQGGKQITAFANGGVVGSPTFFPMANGAGLMGEAGPEAIMPLTRIGGDLGVKAVAGNTYINIHNESGMNLDMRVIKESMDKDGNKTLSVLLNALERNPDVRQAIKGIR